MPGMVAGTADAGTGTSGWHARDGRGNPMADLPAMRRNGIFFAQNRVCAMRGRVIGVKKKYAVVAALCDAFQPARSGCRCGDTCVRCFCMHGESACLKPFPASTSLQ